MVKESAYDTGGLGSIPGLGRLPLEKGMATHSSVCACRMPWTEEPGGLQSIELQTVGHNQATNAMTTSRSHRRPPAGWSNISIRDRFNSHREQATQTQTRDVRGNRRGLFLQPDELHKLRFPSQKEGKRQKNLLLQEDGEAPALGAQHTSRSDGEYVYQCVSCCSTTETQSKRTGIPSDTS